ncbi:MAG: chromosomal replication initiator protein DnaA [Nitrospinae bacterium]|nr:chromosomal replication initiator protein DnaA [Nitrospinota bacterium]
MPSTGKLWDEVKSSLKERLHQHNYDSWIEPVEFVSYKNHELLLAVPSAFFIEWINEHYKESILELMEEATGSRVTLSLSLGAQTKPQPQPQPKEKEKVKVDVAQETLSIKQLREKSNLNEKYTFDNFVVDKSNEFCNALAKGIVAKMGENNPLFIYGGVGLGKTHLMQAIGNAVLEKAPNYNVLYLSSEKFVNDLINSLQRGSMSAFRKKYRNLDLLLVDDIQFIAGKERTQEEFFHTFNTLFEMKKQIILSSDKFPKDITNMEERLRSRFSWGIIADIKPPEVELKTAIIKKIARKNGFHIDDEVGAFLAKRVKSNIRELEGCLARVMAYASLTGKPVDMEMARETLKGIYDEAAKILDIKQIQKAVCDFYLIKLVDVKSKSRLKSVAMPRHVAMFLCREFTNVSLPEIGRAFGGRDHTTVMHAVEKIRNEVEVNTQLYNEINEIKKNLDL